MASFVVGDSGLVNWTNLCYCSPDDLRTLFGTATGGSGSGIKLLPFTIRRKQHLAIFNNRVVFAIQADQRVEKGHIALNPEQREFLDVSLGDRVNLEEIVPQDLSQVRVKVESIANSSTRPAKLVMASSLEKEFGQTFHRQVLTEFQRVKFRYRGTSYACNVVEVSVGGSEEGQSLIPKLGMIRKRTKVIVVVPQSLRKSIQGGETLKGVFRESFNMELLEEELVSLGIGGMATQLQGVLQQAFGSRMGCPYEAKRLNLKHVKGMLLYGPTGSGKTLIARTIGKLLNAKVPKIINGPEVINKYYGESERRIRELFDPAIEDKKRYGLNSDLHIIIFDEFDAIAKNRGEATGHNDGLVNQLLAMIDGFEELNNIFIIATTNRKELIDEAMLREGRIELHVKVDYPDELGRLQILEINTMKMRQASILDEDVNLDEIAHITDGCSGAALASLVNRAYSYSSVQTMERGLVKHEGKDIKVTMNHFLRAVEEFKPKLRQQSRMAEEDMLQPKPNKSAEELQIEQENRRLKNEKAKLEMEIEQLSRAARLNFVKPKPIKRRSTH